MHPKYIGITFNYICPVFIFNCEPCNIQSIQFIAFGVDAALVCIQILYLWVFVQITPGESNGLTFGIANREYQSVVEKVIDAFVVAFKHANFFQYFRSYAFIPGMGQ